MVAIVGVTGVYSGEPGYVWALRAPGGRAHRDGRCLFVAALTLH